MSEIWTSVLNTVGLAWWVEVITETPRCTYYFGPFSSGKEAEEAQGGYIEDLEQEGAQGIKVNVKRCKPSSLTIDDEVSQMNSRNGSRALSSQL
ncbi:DUF1816 domain-containing protein [Oscillatoria sp. FACHB-1407]|uniref:DUF1816 domain-containing protein n=1 Tax=Oscillatoria sp. FACHB-1407 TaxID=2692847 RepID=UPI0016878C22|nr:DUF1816 domain-containing protein [Oscillatoria sp. FACHB-1407]MBD2461716.1 DUF1816 domain-containing protein [Oscillatoria sp. FACHB-1407]